MRIKYGAADKVDCDQHARVPSWGRGDSNSDSEVPNLE